MFFQDGMFHKKYYKKLGKLRIDRPLTNVIYCYEMTFVKWGNSCQKA